ncbi:MAG: HAMP domain-containing protein [Spirochaetes bacterium]|nr:MAG: HAMP domain-containing protein [Spirochaetota bacterium]
MPIFRILRVKPTLRFKLIASIVSVVLIIGVSSVWLGLRIINNNIVGQAYDQVQNDLKTAQFIYDGKINVIHLFMKHLASLPYIKDAVLGDNRVLLINKLQEVEKELGLDIVNITAPDGRVIVRSRNPRVAGDYVSDDIFIRFILENGISCSGTDIMSREYLLREGEDLANQAYIQFVPTAMSRAAASLNEERGMVIKAAAPIYYEGKLIAIIYGAKLLNKNYEIVDQIKSLVFKDEKYEGYEYGTATIFLEDMRISTNVLISRTRAIGTKVSEEVYDRVFTQGRLWLDKAFVVNNWYIAAYSPIYNIRSEVIGILYVGIIESKFEQIKKETAIFFLIILLVTLQVALIIYIYLIHNILNPIRYLVNASNSIAKGDYTINIPVETRDELGILCKTFNTMVGAIVERDTMLKEDTHQQIINSEKLASLGKLAAGIAHEINNPLTGVLTYSSILLEDLKDTEYKDDLEIIVNETMRCRKIVREILNFARETKIEKERVNINLIISETLSILEKHVSFHNIGIVKAFRDDLPPMYVDINQIKSVINNLALNAADAMSDGGTLTIATNLDSENDSVVITVNDTGCGIPEGNLIKIFDPFFTTKETGKGTGLGLAVTYGIIKRHNGQITVHSIPGEGTKFVITLPVNPVDASGV